MRHPITILRHLMGWEITPQRIGATGNRFADTPTPSQAPFGWLLGEIYSDRWHRCPPPKISKWMDLPHSESKKSGYHLPPCIYPPDTPQDAIAGHHQDVYHFQLEIPNEKLDFSRQLLVSGITLKYVSSKNPTMIRDEVNLKIINLFLPTLNPIKPIKHTPTTSSNNQGWMSQEVRING